MSKRSCYLLSAVRVSRPYGGYENSYTISTKGWSKISYLQGYPVPAEKSIAGNCPAEAAQYLVKGKGEEHDIEDHLYFKLIASKLPPLPYFPRLDEEGLLLTFFDPPAGILLGAVNLPQNDHLNATNRALYLQQRGLIPSDIDVPIFVLNAYERGSSSSAILLSLLFRGATQLRDVAAQLRDANILMKLKSKLDLADSRRYKDLLEDEQRTNRSLKLENDSLQKKTDDAHYDAQRERLRLDSKFDRLVDLVKDFNECLRALSQGLGEFEDTSPNVTAIKSYIRNMMLEVAIMNYAIVTEERRNST